MGRLQGHGSPICLLLPVRPGVLPVTKPGNAPCLHNRCKIPHVVEAVIPQGSNESTPLAQFLPGEPKESIQGWTVGKEVGCSRPEAS